MAITSWKDLFNALNKVKNPTVPSTTPSKIGGVVAPAKPNIETKSNVSSDLDSYVKNSIANPNYVSPNSVWVTSSNQNYNTQVANNNQVATPAGQAVNMNTTQNTQPNMTSGANMNTPNYQYNESAIDKTYNDAQNELMSKETQAKRNELLAQSDSYLANLPSMEQAWKDELERSGINKLEAEYEQNISDANDAKQQLRNISSALNPNTNQNARYARAWALADQYSISSTPINELLTTLNESNQLLWTRIDNKYKNAENLLKYRTADVDRQMSAIKERVSLIDNQLTPEQRQLITKKMEAKAEALKQQDQRDFQLYLQRDAQKANLEKTVFDSMIAAGLDPNSVPVEKRSQLLSITTQINRIKQEALKVAPNLKIQRSDAQITADVSKLADFYVSQGMDRASAMSRAIQENFTNPLLWKAEYAQGLKTTGELQALPIKVAEANLANAKNESEHRNALLELDRSKLAYWIANDKAERDFKATESAAERKNRLDLEDKRIAADEKKAKIAEQNKYNEEKWLWTDDAVNTSVNDALADGNIFLKDIVAWIKSPEVIKKITDKYNTQKKILQDQGKIKLNTKDRQDIGEKFITYEKSNEPIKQYQGMKGARQDARNKAQDLANKMKDPNYRMSWAEQIALLKSFSLITDPNSSVREEEFKALAWALQGIATSAAEFIKKATDEKWWFGISNAWMLRLLQWLENIAIAREQTAMNEYTKLWKQIVETYGTDKFYDAVALTWNQMRAIWMTEWSVWQFELDLLNKFFPEKQKTEQEKSLSEYIAREMAKQDANEKLWFNVQSGVKPRVLAKPQITKSEMDDYLKKQWINY